VLGHVPPLLRNFEKLFLNIGIACLLGELLHSRALARYSSALLFTAVAHCLRKITNVDGKELFRQTPRKIKSSGNAAPTGAAA
jgi:hypothetical protein